MSNAERQRQYRQRHLKDPRQGRVRLPALLSLPAKVALERLAASNDLPQRAALERVLLDALERMTPTLTGGPQAEALRSNGTTPRGYPADIKAMADARPDGPERG